MKKLFSFVFTILIIFLAVGGPTVIVHAITLDELVPQLDQVGKDIGTLEADVTAARQNVSNRKQKSELLADLAAIRGKLLTIKNTLAGFPAPPSLAAETGSCGGVISLTYTPSGSVVTRYTLERHSADPNAPWKSVSERASVSELPDADRSLPPGAEFRYRLRALGASGETSSPETVAVAASPFCLLSVSKAGTGSGAIASLPAGVSCGADCSGRFAPMESVTLSATPSADSTFAGWNGACANATGDCAITVNSVRSVTATFTLKVFTLSATKLGTGAGSVSSNPAGINCGADCSAPFNINTPVSFTATPAADSLFTGWSGACSGTGPCTVSPNASKTVTATFALKTFALTATKTAVGGGTGTVVSSPDGIDCGATCVGTFDIGTVVSVTATPATDSIFSGWTGACSGAAFSCTTTMNGAKTVAATFTKLYPLTVSKGTSTGAGVVTSSPAGIDCGSDCSATYTPTKVVTLTAAPDVNSDFIGWSGACTGSTTCTVTMDAAKNVIAAFTLKSAGLSVTAKGTGAGTVTSNPTGINCGTDCSQPYNINTVVTLTAAADADSDFTSWSGCDSNPTLKTCAVTIGANPRAVSATFTLKVFTLSATKLGTGAGSVSSNPAGINCGADCSGSYKAGTPVTLSAAPDASSIFTGWTGGCVGSVIICTVTVDAAKSVTASFTAKPILTVTKTGTGDGSITSNPAGINCGATCSDSYGNLTTRVTLTAAPDQHSTFAGWSGACDGVAETCEVTLAAAQQVAGRFDRAVVSPSMGPTVPQPQEPSPTLRLGTSPGGIAGSPGTPTPAAPSPAAGGSPSRGTDTVLPAATSPAGGEVDNPSPSSPVPVVVLGGNGRGGSPSINTRSGSLGGGTEPAPTPTTGEVASTQRFPFGPIVPCGNRIASDGTVLDPCTFNHFLIGIKNLTNYLIVLAASLAALAFAWAGILYLTAGGNPSQIETAHAIFWKVFKGFIVMLAAWLIVYTITAALIPREKRDQGFTLLKETQ